ncbi:MAG: hypothetical protein PUB52_00550 [Lachnospiraceae bacterium]|nr:hypothetical protein [Lachnospiraceae bacterium]
MYKMIWNHIQKSSLAKDKKVILFLFCCVITFSLLGALVWAAAARFFLPGVIWLICFAGYPGCFAGYFGGVLFLWRQEV